MAIFLTIGIVGLVIVATSLLFGEIIEGAFELDFLGGDLFSVPSLAAFLGAFGFGGVISLSIVDITGIAVVVGIIAGVLAAWGATALTRVLKRGENAATFRSDLLVGATGRVITDIPESGYGEVRIFGTGGSRKRSARADTAIPAGTEVWISSVLSPTAVEVTSIDELPPPQSIGSGPHPG